jgi:hypothetical protein
MAALHFKDRSVTPIRVGLDSIGIVGLQDALKTTDELSVDDRSAVADRMMEALRSRNYIPESQVEAYRTAFWREFLRHRGRDFSEWYSEVPVTVRGEPGEERDRLVELVTAVLAGHELRPTFSFAPVGPGLELAIRDEVVARGPQNRASLERAVRRTFSHW